MAHPKHTMYETNSSKTRYFERGLSKSLNKLTQIFLLHPVFLGGQGCEKQKGTLTSYQSVFKLCNMLRKNPFLVIYHMGILMI